MLDDYSPMPSGPYKNKLMIDVPAEYLLKALKDPKLSKEVKEYIEDNLDVLELECKKKNKNCKSKEVVKTLVVKNSIEEGEEEGEYFDCDDIEEVEEKTDIEEEVEEEETI